MVGGAPIKGVPGLCAGQLGPYEMLVNRHPTLCWASYTDITCPYNEYKLSL